MEKVVCKFDIHNHLSDELDKIIDTRFLEENKLLKGLENNTIKFDNFVKSQEGFVICVNYWSQILGKLIFRLDSFIDRKIILENLMDEHGIGGKYSHVETFSMFITKLGGKVPIYYGGPALDFNLKLHNYSKESLANFIATLGFIEFYYQKISAIIVKYLKINNKFINIHYEEHEELDIKHYTDLFSLLKRFTKDEITNALKNGSLMAIKLFDEYYNSCFDLYC